MKCFASLIVSLALGAAPVFAETAKQSTLTDDQPSIWLVLSAGYGDFLHSLPMKSMDQCEEQGATFLSSTRIKRLKDYLGFECLEGK